MISDFWNRKARVVAGEFLQNGFGRTPLAAASGQAPQGVRSVFVTGNSLPSQQNRGHIPFPLCQKGRMNLSDATQIEETEFAITKSKS